MNSVCREQDFDCSWISNDRNFLFHRFLNHTVDISQSFSRRTLFSASSNAYPFARSQMTLSAEFLSSRTIGWGTQSRVSERSRENRCSCLVNVARQSTLDFTLLSYNIFLRIIQLLYVSVIPVASFCNISISPIHFSHLGKAATYAVYLLLDNVAFTYNFYVLFRFLLNGLRKREWTYYST